MQQVQELLRTTTVTLGNIKAVNMLGILDLVIKIITDLRDDEIMTLELSYSTANK